MRVAVAGACALLAIGVAAAPAQTEPRDPVARLEAQLAAQHAAEQRAEAARQAAAAERQQREQAAADADVQQVLERARNDYPVLRTPAGEPILRSILARQKVLQESGLYPSIAMVEAVADHAEALRPRVRAEAPPPEAVPPQAAPDYSKNFGNCRWLTPYTWSCK
jgi:hypothetical protein